MIPATMPACLADVIKRHGGEWLEWECTADEEGRCEYRAKEVAMVATLGMARSSLKAFISMSMFGRWGEVAQPLRWEFDPENIEDCQNLADNLRKPLHRELTDLAEMNRPSMCSEVSRLLRVLAAKVEAG